VSSAFFIVRYFSTKLAFFVLKDEKKQEKVCAIKKKQYLCTAIEQRGVAQPG
jgi:hypothetical protein